ncbi:PREDICTED: uncharacterized protein LOC106323748 [Brassica oleracea var. oleracea]|uniref:uncharacterized protein LOC106323748 n=1 Tax=Brassica oleracea var. oleracea TaxID=109376 RepID=UPI0006A6D548|nr:PREDICTED: uncharacterized protein LOC106323748 [Brassica oleracea var. oleracea]
MRKVIVVDATILKNGYGGVLVFAKAQDPNRHHYPLLIGVLNGENNDSLTWFFEMLKTAIPDSSELVFMSDRNQSLIVAVANVFPQSHHGHCIWHLSQNVRGHACNTTKAVVGWRFMELARCYTLVEFESAYASFKVRYPPAYKYLEEHTDKSTWARVHFPGVRYNLDTSNSVELMNSVFKDARRYALIPLLDTIIKKFSDWFNEYRKDSVARSIDTKLVYDYEKYSCLHGLAAYLYFLEVEAAPGRRRDIRIEYHELCSKYYWTELWALAYYKTIYSVPDMSEWNVPDHIKELQSIPPDRLKRKGRKKNKRNPSVGEQRKRTQNIRRPRKNFGFSWLLFGMRSSNPSESN